MKTRTHLYKNHLEAKRMRMICLLEKIGCERLCQKITPSPLHQGFRNRAKFRVYENQGEVRIEGTDPQKGDVPFERALWILPEWGRPIVKHLANYRRTHRDEFPFDGFELQLMHGRRRAHAVISVKRVFPEIFISYARDLWEKTPELTGMAIPSQMIDLGDVHLDHQLLGKHFLAHYDSFFQSNLSLTPKLLDKIASEAKEIDYKGIVDLYCGVGLLSLSFAKKDTGIVGVESDKKAVDCASKNASRHGFESTSFIHSKVENFVKNEKFRPDNLVILNPPRAGCDSSVIASIARQRPKNVLLVSCYLETQVRDLELWQSEGYDVASVSAFDMFPFTPFLETVIRMTDSH